MNLSVSLNALWVDEYRTGSGSDWVGLAIKTTYPFQDLPRRLASNDDELRGTQTQSLPPPHAGCPRGDPGPLPVLYLSTHDNVEFRNLARWFCATIGHVRYSFAARCAA